MTFDADQLKKQIPYYLTSDREQRDFAKNLGALNDGVKTGYYIPAARAPNADSMLQGDGWCGFQLFSFETNKKRSVHGIVLSNSCDISRDNKRDYVPKIVFAPIVRLSAIEIRFKSLRIAGEVIRDKLDAIRKQSISNIFFLPSGGQLEHDHVVLLDDIHSMPVSAHTGGKKLFTLSMAGFYLFAFKISVHFCRLQENVDRRP